MLGGNYRVCFMKLFLNWKEGIFPNNRDGSKSVGFLPPDATPGDRSKASYFFDHLKMCFLDADFQQERCWNAGTSTCFGLVELVNSKFFIES